MPGIGCHEVPGAVRGRFITMPHCADAAAPSL
jgi:hypothetical protein